MIEKDLTRIADALEGIQAGIEKLLEGGADAPGQAPKATGKKDKPSSEPEQEVPEPEPTPELDREPEQGSPADPESPIEKYGVDPEDVTVEMVRDALKELARATDQNTARGVLKAAGSAASMRELDPDLYFTVYAAARDKLDAS